MLRLKLVLVFSRGLCDEICIVGTRGGKVADFWEMVMAKTYHGHVTFFRVRRSNAFEFCQQLIFSSLMSTVLPSEKLRSLAFSKKEKEFKQVLETSLYPFLDQLPATHKKSLLAVLDNTSARNEVTGFEMRSKSISYGINGLLRSVQADQWGVNWEPQVGFSEILVRATHPDEAVCRARWKGCMNS